MYKSLVSAAICAVVIAGCGTSHPLQNSFAETASGEDEGTKTEEVKKKERANVNNDYVAAYGACLLKMKEYRSGMDRASTTSLQIAAIGIIAGSIVVPALAAKAAASKAAIAAWGGVAGSANAAQAMLDTNGMSPGDALAVYTVARNNMLAANKKFHEAKGVTEKKVAVVELSMACNVPDLTGIVGVQNVEEKK